MRSVTYSMGVSLDGYIVGPDGGFGWASRAAGELQATGQTNASADQPARDSLTPQERRFRGTAQPDCRLSPT